jgi:hypothetical protein
MICADWRKSGANLRVTIYCDDVQQEKPGSKLLAIGTVTFSGAGMKCKCQRLTLSANEARIIFEGNVEIVGATAEKCGCSPGGACALVGQGGVLHGERIVWDASADRRAAEETSKDRPVRFEFPPPPALTPPALSPPVALDGLK